MVFALALASCSPSGIEYDVEFSDHNNGKMLIPYLEDNVDIDNVHLLDDYNLSTPELSEPHRATSVPLTVMFLRLFESAIYRSIHQVSGTYESIDMKGNPIVVSGKLMYPKDGKIKNLIIVSHYSIGADFEAPSESFYPEGLFVTMGYAVAIADYIGFGVTSDSIHPYLQAYTTAQNVIDMGLASRALLHERGLKCESDSVILCGYSQGGATTMYVQYLLENFYPDLFKIKKNYSGSGIYDVARTYDYFVEKDIIGIPTAIPMIIQGMSIGMDEPLDMSYFFKDKLLNNYEEWINSKKYTIKQINALIDCYSLKQLVKPEAVDKAKPETMRFYKELQENSLPSHFVPKAPVYLFHSVNDDTVPFVNSQILQQRIITALAAGRDVKAEFDFGHYGPHTNGAIKFIFKVAKQLDW